MGRTHALSGAAVWLAGAPPAAELLGQPLSTAETLAGGLLCSGAALLPDLDSSSSSAARSLPPASWAAAKLLGTIAGGHRHATHSLAFVAVVFAGLTAALATPAAAPVTIVVSWLCVGLALRALGPTPLRGASLADLSVAGVAAGLVALGWHTIDSTGWWPVAITVGCAIHIAGDLLTSGGVRLLWPLPHRQALPVISRTGGPLEHVASSVLLVIVGGLALDIVQ